MIAGYYDGYYGEHKAKSVNAKRILVTTAPILLNLKLNFPKPKSNLKTLKVSVCGINSFLWNEPRYKKL